jgi:Methane oxygenase PmoA
MVRKALLPIVLSVVALLEGASAAELRVTLHRTGYQIDVAVGRRPFTTFYFDPAVAKPYLFPLRSAQGAIVTRSFPMVTNLPGEDRNEPHQRAMYFAHGDINGFDFWGEAAFKHWSHHPVSRFGRTIFRKLDVMRGGPDAGAVQAEFDLVTHEGQAVASEIQTYVFRGDERTRMIDCEFTLRADHGRVRIGDTKEGTFAIRVVKALDAPPGHMVNSNGAVGEKAVWGKRADWVDDYGSIAGETVGIAIFDNPTNLRHPTWWHARHYGVLAANPFGLKEFTHNRHQDGGYVIAPGRSLTLRYRVIIHQGDFRAARVAEAYRQYAAGQ